MSLDQVWVPASGPHDAVITFVGEAPGREEAIEGAPFVGPSGQILWPMAWRLARVRREQVYLTNWHKTMLTKELKDEYEKDPSLAAHWTEQLHTELAQLPDLRVVVALGAYALRAVLPDLRFNIYWANGLAIRREDGLIIVPVGHPAAGMHESSMLERTWHGLKGLGRYLETQEEWPGFADAGLDKTLASDPYFPVALSMNPSIQTVAIDTEGTPGAPFCLTFSVEDGRSWLIYAHEAKLLEWFRTWLETRRPMVVLHNANWDLDVMQAMGIAVEEMGLKIVDTLIWANLLQDRPRDLKNLTMRELAIPMTTYTEVVAPWHKMAVERWRGEAYYAALMQLHEEQQFTPKGRPKLSKGSPVYKTIGPPQALKIKTNYERNFKFPLAETKWAEAHVGKVPGEELRLVPPEQHVPYAGRDARVTLQLARQLEPEVKREHLTNVAKLDHAVLPLIRDMQNRGLHMDLERYHEVMAEVSTTRERLIVELKDMTHPDFNPGSADQVEEALREHEYELEKKTASGKRYSTAENILRILRERYEDTKFLDSLLEYRENDKYLNTYLLPLGQDVKEASDGWRLFHRFGLPTVSGRLTGRVLTWPARTKLGLKLRSIFTAPPGKMLASWDLSQIELRLAAAFSRDPVMTEAFLSGKDLHTNLASKLFGVPYEQVDKMAQRYPSKLIHYLLLYGGGGGKLYEELRGARVKGFTLEQCYELIKSTWEQYAAAGRYLEGKSREAKRTGEVRDFLGRRRFLPGASIDEGAFGWALRKLRLEAERQAGNYDIQAGAAEVIKEAMLAYWRIVRPATSLRLWLQLHDELMGEMEPEEWDRVNAMMHNIMTASSTLTDPIPIETEGAHGMTWAELK